MDPFSIAALIAMVAGAGVQYKASTDAAKRQDKATRESLDRQQEYQQKAEKKALDTADSFNTDDRLKEQTQIEDTITQELAAPVSESQAIRATQQETQGNTSDDYKSAKTKSDLETLKSTQALARLLGKTQSSGRLRTNEAIRMMDTGQDIGTLQNFANGQKNADAIGIQVAGRPNAGMQFAGSVLQGIGSAGLSAGGGGVSSGSLSAANASADPIAALNASQGWTGSGTSLTNAFRGKFNGMFA